MLNDPWHLFPKSKLNQFYVSFALRSFAISLVGLFVPLYLYKEMGYTLMQTLHFYIFYAVIFAIFVPIAAKYCARFGIRHSVLFSIPFFVLYLGSLYFLEFVKLSLIIPGILLGVSLAFYWMGVHCLFHNITDQKHRGEEVGTRTAIKVLGATIGPLVGGILIHYIGFALVFFLAALLLLFSAGVLFLSKEDHTKYHFSWKSIINKKHWNYSLFFVSRGSEVVANGLVWPLFIFFILKDYLSLGLMGSILAGVTALVVWLVGKYSDHTNKRRIILWVTGFDSLAWFLRSIVATVSHVFGVTILAALTHGVKMAPIGALEYDNATPSDVMGYFVSREIFVNLGRILMVLIVIMLNSLQGGLLFQGFATLAALFF